jgi:hypothetical protein
MENRIAGSADLANQTQGGPVGVEAVNKAEYLAEYKKNLLLYKDGLNHLPLKRQLQQNKRQQMHRQLQMHKLLHKHRLLHNKLLHNKLLLLNNNTHSKLLLRCKICKHKFQRDNQTEQTTQTAQQAYVPYVPPIYQAPYLSGTRFTPVGQYVQDPNTGQPVAQAYIPLNQGYGAAAANFYQQVQGGYGTPETQIFRWFWWPTRKCIV